MPDTTDPILAAALAQWDACYRRDRAPLDHRDALAEVVAAVREAIAGADPNPHAVCFATHDALRADLRRAVDIERRAADANTRIGRAIRMLTLPGVKAKTIRIDRLRDLVTDADEEAGRG